MCMCVCVCMRVCQYVRVCVRAWALSFEGSKSRAAKRSVLSLRLSLYVWAHQCNSIYYVKRKDVSVTFIVFYHSNENICIRCFCHLIIIWTLHSHVMLSALVLCLRNQLLYYVYASFWSISNSRFEFICV